MKKKILALTTVLLVTFMMSTTSQASEIYGWWKSEKTLSGTKRSFTILHFGKDVIQNGKNKVYGAKYLNEDGKIIVDVRGARTIISVTDKDKIIVKTPMYSETPYKRITEEEAKNLLQKH